MEMRSTCLVRQLGYRGDRFTPNTSQRRFRLYLRFGLRLCEHVEDMLTAGGLEVIYETMRR